MAAVVLVCLHICRCPVTSVFQLLHLPFSPHVLTICRPYTCCRVLSLLAGMTVTPTAHSGRIVVAFWWCCAIIIVGTYNGNLIAFLTAPNVAVSRVTSLEQLKLSSKTHLGFLAGTDMQDLFKSAVDDTYDDLWRRIELDPAAFLVDVSVICCWW